MYTDEMRIKAIELWLKYDKCTAAVIHELGYPGYITLTRWCKAYQQEQKTGITHQRKRRDPIFSEEQQQKAITYYLEHGKCLSRTIRALGYPNRDTLRKWRDKAIPELRKFRKRYVQYSQEQKTDAVIALCSRQGCAQEVAEAAGTNRITLHKWRNELLGKENAMAKAEKQSPDLPDDKNQLLSEIESLKVQVRRLKLEKDILEAAAELVKKDPGVNLKSLSNREKTILVGALKPEYALQELLDGLCLPKSSYYYQVCVLSCINKYEQLKTHIIELFNANNRCYGYRRIHSLLLQEGRKVSEKVVRRLMVEANLFAQSKRKRKYNSYQGEITPAPANLLERDFHADSPNTKWLTDITEFHIPAGKAYLSPIVDCFDGLLVSWTVSTRPDAELVNTMLDLATGTLDGKHPIIHSDRGCHYRWPGWLERIEKSGLIQSMSKKGCSPDNAACEGLFGRIKNEMFYNRSWADVSMDSFMDNLDSYLNWYNNKRIKMSLGGMSPAKYRLSLGLTP